MRAVLHYPHVPEHQGLSGVERFELRFTFAPAGHKGHIPCGYIGERYKEVKADLEVNERYLTDKNGEGLKSIKKAHF